MSGKITKDDTMLFLAGYQRSVDNLGVGNACAALAIYGHEVNAVELLEEHPEWVRCIWLSNEEMTHAASVWGLTLAGMSEADRIASDRVAPPHISHKKSH